ncbi:MAG: hypothetical protein OEZ04_09835 [Nitrospinota bacterium]|nr:hypothetical protein [Nitrospinota bacterium]
MTRKRGMKVTAALIVAAMLVMPLNAAHGAAANIAVNVNVGAHIILNTVATVNLTVTGVDAAATPAGVVAGTATFAGNLNTVAAGGSLGWTDPAAYGSLITVNVTDAWGVRAMVGVGQNVLITPSITTGTGLNTAASSVTVGALTAGCGACGAGGAAVAAGATCTFPAPGMGSPGVSGDVGFTLDISGVTLVGNHTGIVLTITAAAV